MRPCTRLAVSVFVFQIGDRIRSMSSVSTAFVVSRLANQVKGSECSK